MLKRASFGPVLLAMIVGGVAGLRSQAPAGASAVPPDLDIQVYHVRGPVYVLSGAGCNITASIGPDGVVLVDAGSAPNADTVLAVIQQIQRRLATSGAAPLGYGAETRSSLERLRVTPAPLRPIRFILSTSMDPDHTGGNATIAATGQSTTGGNVAQALSNSGEGAAIYAHENVLLGLSKPPRSGPPVPFAALPTATYRAEYYKLQPFMNGEGIELFHRPAASTDGDSLVWFRTSDVIATGDLFSTITYPRIDLERGGGIQGTIDALNAILDLAFPEFRNEGGTLIIPGHGRVSDYADVAYYRDMVTIVRDRVQDMIRKGSTLEQVKAARPSADYDPRYATPDWTADQFVEAVYRSLNAH